MKEEIIDFGILGRIKLKKIEERKIIIIGKCPFCDKEIKGSTHSQVEWNLALHIKQKHKDNKDAQILLKQMENSK